MAFKDLRDWVAALEERAALKRISAEVDWNEEIGAITFRSIGLKGPALLFENIKDYQDGDFRRVMTASLGTYRRIAMMLGLPTDSSPGDLIRLFRQRIKSPVEPVLVATGPIKQNVLQGQDVNLLRLPVPKWNHRDGGRYLLTFGGIVTKDPDSGWSNVGLYRGMLLDETSMAIQAPPDKHIHWHRRKFAEQSQPLPVAVVFGGDPTFPFCASTGFPPGTSEYGMMGALRQEPVELVKCETIDLEVPAHAEIVLEGTVHYDPSTYRYEGPFGEFTGFFGGERSLQPVMQVHCITYRDDPIFTGSPRSKPIDEAGYIDSIVVSADAWSSLEKIGVPGVNDVFCSPVTSSANVIVQISKRYQGHAKQVAAALWGSKPGGYKNVMVVDDDIDIHNPVDLEWAFTWRVDAAADGIVVFPGLPGLRYDPSTDARWKDPNKHGRARWNRVLIDATADWRWEPREEWDGRRLPPVVESTPEMKSLVARRWKEYGL
ncbi:MAG: UbiD family decarboxylase [Chloroflexi bacterium]|nr:UbiD family decarboxylase [Chloroflexota bacterium]